MYLSLVDKLVLKFAFNLYVYASFKNPSKVNIN